MWLSCCAAKVCKKVAAGCRQTCTNAEYNNYSSKVDTSRRMIIFTLTAHWLHRMPFKLEKKR